MHVMVVVISLVLLSTWMSDCVWVQFPVYGLWDHRMILLCSTAGFVCLHCVRLSRLLVGFRTHFKSMHFHSFHSVSSPSAAEKAQSQHKQHNHLCLLLSTLRLCVWCSRGNWATSLSVSSRNHRTACCRRYDKSTASAAAAPAVAVK